MKLRCAVLDDDRSAAATAADWSPVAGGIDVVSFAGHRATEDELAARLAEFGLVVTLRGRVPFPATLIERLPRLRLIVASGMRDTSIDHAAAERHGVTVCGTASTATPPVGLTWALPLALARGLVTEAGALRNGGPWQSTVGADLYGPRRGALGLGKTGTRVAAVGRAFGTDVVAWSRNPAPERAEEAGDGPRRVRGGTAGDQRPRLRAPGAERAHARTAGREGTRADAARQLSGQHLPGGDRRPGRAARRAAPRGRRGGGRRRVRRRAAPAADHPMRSAPRLLATPHPGYVSQAGYAAYHGDAVEDIRAHLDREPVRRFGRGGAVPAFPRGVRFTGGRSRSEVTCVRGHFVPADRGGPT